MSGTRKISSFKSFLQGVPSTGPNVQPMHSWDQLAKAIRDTQNYLVTAQADEARCEQELDDARKERENAEKLFEEAKSMWAQRSLDLLGVKVETKPETK
jgi:hypothetical protein